MENVKEKKEDFILLVGAGASRDIGYPTLEDLLKQAMLGDDEIDQLIRNTNSILSLRNPSMANFEGLISQLKEYKRIASALRTDYILSALFKSISNVLDIEKKFAEALIKCYRIMAVFYGPGGVNNNAASFTFLREFFKRLAESNTKGVSESSNHLHVYTTNYDCSYQVMAYNFNDISFMSHISNEDGKYQDGWFNIRKDFEPAYFPEIFIHRLHGCVTWYNTPNEEGILSTIREKMGSGEGKHKTNYSDYELQNMCIKLVTPQPLGKHKVFSGTFDEFNKHLEEITTLIIWGYSFRDFEVVSQINQALIIRKENPFNIFYIDPYLNEYAVHENIINTLGVTTIRKSPDFKPQQINWYPYQGHDKLTEMVIEKIKNSTTATEEMEDIHE